MQVINWSQFIEKGLPFASSEKQSVNGLPKTAMTIGVFDGVHRGHQALIERVVSHNNNYVPVVITFKENHKSTETAGIQSFEQRLKIFEQLGIQITIVIDFTESFRRIKGTDFLEILHKHGNVGFFAVGKSFRCGYQLDTDAQSVREFFVSRKIQTEIADEVMEGELPISSSRIRAAVANGNFQLAEAMLGRPAGNVTQT